MGVQDRGTFEIEGHNAFDPETRERLNSESECSLKQEYQHGDENFEIVLDRFSIKLKLYNNLH